MGGCAGKIKNTEQDLSDQPEQRVETEMDQVVGNEIVNKGAPSVDLSSHQAETKEVTFVASDDHEQDKFETHHQPETKAEEVEPVPEGGAKVESEAPLVV